MNTPFSNRNIWLIGASHGIGRALALELHKAGAQLVLSGRDRDALIELNQRLSGKHSVIAFDVGEAGSVSSAYKTLTIQGIELDSMIYMAGYYEPERIGEIEEANLTASLAVNFNGAVHCVQQVLPLFTERSRGQIVICGSLSAYRGLPSGQPYSASKAALVNFTESLKAELQGQGIDVRLLSPGYVKTRLTAKNSFAMPDLMEPKDAALAIIDGLGTDNYETRFPARFARKLKLLKILPDRLYFRLIKRVKTE